MRISDWSSDVCSSDLCDADIADQVSDSRSGGIIARKSSRRGDAGQFGQADRNGRILGVIQLVCNLHRLKTGGLFQIRLDTIHLVRVEREQIRERSDRSSPCMESEEQRVGKESVRK